MFTITKLTSCEQGDDAGRWWGGQVLSLLPIPLIGARQHLREGGGQRREGGHRRRQRQAEQDCLHRPPTWGDEPGEPGKEEEEKHLKLFRYDSMIFQLATYEPHAFLVVLAVDDLSSLDTVSGGKIIF